MDGSTTGERAGALTIGEFGRRTGLSAKALRLYDMSGLLPPAAVDPVSGYRRYTPDQVERARRISLLRQIDMPLAIIAEVLAGTDTDAAIRLDRWWQAQESAMAARRGSFEYLRDHLNRDTGDRAPYEITVHDVPETKLASIRRDVDQQSLVGVMNACRAELGDFLRAGAATPSGEEWVIFHGHVTPDSEATVEVCAPFAGTVDPVGSIAIRVEPAHTVARCTVSKGDCCYPKIMLAYGDIEDWVRASDYAFAGPAREVYFAGCAVGDDDPFAHVAIPVTVP